MTKTRSHLKQEWPTLILTVLCYASYMVILSSSLTSNPTVAVCLLAIVLALHSSLQHENIHGHPFNNSLFNDLIIMLPIGLFVPYHRFRDTHLAHHKDTNLTDPYDDPETAYIDDVCWRDYPRSLKFVLAINNTLLGRMLLGPAIGLIAFYRSELRKALKRDRSVTRAWLIHAAGLTALLPLLNMYSSLDIPQYLLACYLCMSLIKIRTFAEHQAHESVPGRIAIVESRGPLGWLFLFNNYHSVHHQFPRMPWHRLPGTFEKEKAKWLCDNSNNHFISYGVLFKRYLLCRRDPVQHPLWSSENRGQSPVN